jgi:hypothetical protein
MVNQDVRQSLRECDHYQIDASMSEFIEEAPREHGVSRAELLRRILEFYRDSHREETTCPWCDEPILMDLET